MTSEISTKNLRVFGFIWAIIFAYLSYKNILSAKIFFVLFCVFFAISILQPQLFLKTRIYQNWVKFGNILGKINGFLISSILFFLIFTPAAIVLKILKKDLLNKKLNSSANSYFIDRKSQPGDMKNQF